jgi:uncharacterized membrane protein YgcG
MTTLFFIVLAVIALYLIIRFELWGLIFDIISAIADGSGGGSGGSSGGSGFGGGDSGGGGASSDF